MQGETNNSSLLHTSSHKVWGLSCIYGLYEQFEFRFPFKTFNLRGGLSRLSVYGMLDLSCSNANKRAIERPMGFPTDACQAVYLRLVD